MQCFVTINKSAVVAYMLDTLTNQVLILLINRISSNFYLPIISCIYLYVTGYGKRAHFAQELIFQNKQLKFVTPLDFVHNSDSLKCYNFSQKDQFFML